MKKIIILFICVNIFLMPSYAYIIEDDFAQKTLDKNLKIEKRSTVSVTDDFAQANTNKNPTLRVINIDEVTPSNYQKFVKRPVLVDDNYNEIKVRVKKPYSTKNVSDEGDLIEFETIEEVKIKDIVYPKNTTISGRIETISKNETYGVPSDLIVGNFKLNDTVLSGEIKKTGANRAIWVRPTVCVLSCFFGLGLPLILVRGGHAKIRPSETYVLYAP